MQIIFAFLLFLNSYSSFSQDRELLVFASDQEGFPAGALCFFSNNYLTVHQDGVLVLYTCLGGREIYSEVWLAGSVQGNRLIARSEEGNMLKRPILHQDRIIIVEYSEMGTDKLHLDQNGRTQIVNVPSEYRRTHIHDIVSLGEEIWFRYTDHLLGIHGEGVIEGEKFTRLGHRGVSYFFAPAASSQMMVQKVRRGEPGQLGEEQPDEIEIRLAPDYKPLVVFKDQDADPQSPVKSISNTMTVNDLYWAVMGSRDQKQVLILGKGSEVSIHPMGDHFKTIDAWPGALDSEGAYYFRGTHRDGTVGLWKWHQGKLSMRLGKNEVIQVGSIELRTSSRALFYNSPVIDHQGRILIGVGLSDPETGRDIGQGVLRF